MVSVISEEYFEKISLCICCLQCNGTKRLWHEYYWQGESEIYGELLSKCFVLKNDYSKNAQICESCIERLRAAVQFKNQVINAAKEFKQLTSHNTRLPVGDDFKYDDIKTEYEGADIAHELNVFESAVVSETEIETEDTLQEEIDKTIKDKNTNRKKSKKDSMFGVRPEDYKKENNKYICSRCEDTYSMKHTIINHIRQKHLNLSRIPRKKCKYCQKLFLSPGLVLQHILDEHGIDDRLECKACEAKFLSTEGFKNHMKSYHKLGGQVYKCDYCDYEAYLNTRLVRHMVKHKTTEIFYCKFCNKAFSRKKTMLLHERIHTGDKRNVCKVCEKAFVQKASLNYHMKTYHPEVNF